MEAGHKNVVNLNIYTKRLKNNKPGLLGTKTENIFVQSAGVLRTLFISKLCICTTSHEAALCYLVLISN